MVFGNEFLHCSCRVFYVLRSPEVDSDRVGGGSPHRRALMMSFIEECLWNCLHPNVLQCHSVRSAASASVEFRAGYDLMHVSKCALVVKAFDLRQRRWQQTRNRNGISSAHPPAFSFWVIAAVIKFVGMCSFYLARVWSEASYVSR